MRVVAGLVAVAVCSTAFAALPVQRTLSFEERVNAQAAIERVYYAHQIGATKPFQEAVPRSVLENKVRKYLEQTVALQTYWKTAVTDETLQRELERMAQGTRMPERLQELYTALGNDPFLIKECLTRPALVDRLTQNFYAFDPTIHATARAQADAIHQLLASGELSPKADHPNRTMSELVMGEADASPATPGLPMQRRMTPGELQKQRGELPAVVGEVSQVKETRDAFGFSVILNETSTRLRVASYAVPKNNWDSWWATVHGSMANVSVAAVATVSAADKIGDQLPAPRRGSSVGSATNCSGDTWDNGILGNPDAGAPSGRVFHTAIWTGSLMLVWGGADDYSLPTTGGRYDPATDSWTATSTVAAPSARADHTAVWSGTKMLVWGGDDSDGYLNTGGLYDPVADTWTPMSVVGAPSGRLYHGAIWTGSVMVVWGGWFQDTADRYPTAGGRYDPATDTWQATSLVGAPVGRASPKVVWTGNVMLVWGGGNNFGFFVDGRRYDPATDTWMAMANALPGSPDPASTAVWTGSSMLVWGSGSSSVTPGQRYDPVTNTWTQMSIVGAPFARAAHTAVWTGNEMIVWGGSPGTDTGGLYDPIANTWKATTTDGAPTGRLYPTAVWTGSVMVIWGGERLGSYLGTGGRYIDANLPDGTSCTDQNACTSGDVCAAGSCLPGAPANCDDYNPCTSDTCDPQSGCVHTPEPEFTYCDDYDACTGADYCDGYGTCVSVYPPQCDDHIVCTEDYCDPATGCAYRMYPAGTSCSDGNACNGAEVCDGDGGCAADAPLGCDDDNPCTRDSCDPGSGCVHAFEPEFTACDDSNACNGVDYCDGFGTCVSPYPIQCPDNNVCTEDFCDPVIGCVSRPYPAGSSCSDGNACNGVELCDGAGSCASGNPVICNSLDQCHSIGVCDPASGACSNPIAANGTVCNDGNLCTTGETCQSGTCTPAFSGLNEPNPRSNGYYLRLCLGPHSGDQLTNADAVCVGQVAGTFAGITTVADLCAVLRPLHPNNDPCDRTSADLMVLALNICRARVCTAQSIDSQCGGNDNVGQSLAESDAIVLSSSHDDTTCAHAKCLDEEINTGRALELNTLGLRREGNGIRLDWQPPYLDDGTGHPSKYHVWRRVQGSLAPFAKIGTTTNPTYLDALSGSGAFEYEVTAVMN